MYACYNNPPAKDFLVVFDGYEDETRSKVKTKEIPNRMTRDCQYSKDTVDIGCVGCVHNIGEKNG
jgi:hypothetical protein